MRRWALLNALAFIACAPAAYAAEPIAVSLVVENGPHTDAVIWREGDDLLADNETFAALNMIAPPGDGPHRLAAKDGLTYSFDEAASVVLITCTSACYRTSELRATLPPEAPTETQPISALIVNYDATIGAVGDDRSGAALIETAYVAPNWSFENAMTAKDEGGVDVTRLDTAITIDRPKLRQRLVIGDTVTRAGAWGAPVRFGGVKFGTDFSLQPGFVSFPTPSLRGSSELPSTVELYIDDALRFTGEAPAGPFSIEDAPVVSGAGVARIVVTDPLGRERVIAAPFYASPNLLRPGVADYTIDLGYERFGYGVDSADYRNAVGAVMMRRGFTDEMTGEGRLEARDNRYTIGAAIARSSYALGVVELAGAYSDGDRDGAYGKFGISRTGSVFSFTGVYEVIGAHFESDDGVAPRSRAVASLGWQLDRTALTLSGTHLDMREEEDARTLGASARFDLNDGADATISALHVDGEDEGFALSAGVSMRFGQRGYATTALEQRDGETTAIASAQSTPLSAGGFGWRAAARSDGRYDGAASFLGLRGFIEVEASRSAGVTGARARAMGGVVFADNAVFVTREVRDSFAIVTARPGLDVELDNRDAGRADENGKLFVSGLHRYTPHVLSFDASDAPIESSFVTDNVRAAPQGRAGVAIRFGFAEADARWVHIVTVEGQALPVGATLKREDGEMFFVGEDGRAYLSATASTRFETKVGERACVVDLRDEGDVLTCKAA